MATQSRRKSPSLIQQIQTSAPQFEFFQAVRLLEQASAVKTKKHFADLPVGQYTPLNRESIQFKSQPSLAFSGHDINHVKPVSTKNKEDKQAPDYQWHMGVDIFGLIGSNGVLPYCDSENVITRLRSKDKNLVDFIDLFNHRSVSLLHESWLKYRHPPNFERYHRNKTKTQREDDLDVFSQVHASIAGLGTKHIRKREPVPDDVLMHFGPLLAKGPPSAPVLEHIIQYYFGLPITVEQFVGEWHALPKDIQSRFPCRELPNGLNNQLGVNVIVGETALQAQSTFNIRFGKLNYQDFMSFMPNKPKMEQLKSLVRFCVGIDYDFNIILPIQKNSIPTVGLGSDRGLGSDKNLGSDTSLNDDKDLALGWNSQLYTQSQINAQEQSEQQAVEKQPSELVKQDSNHKNTNHLNEDDDTIIEIVLSSS